MPELKKLLKKGNNRTMLVIFIIGTVIILLSLIFDSSGKEANTAMRNSEGEEARLSEILSKVDGVGEVEVMITYEESAENNLGSGYGKSEKVVKPKGVIIVVDGAENTAVRAKLKEAAAAVIGVGANRVCVFQRNTRK